MNMKDMLYTIDRLRGAMEKLRASGELAAQSFTLLNREMRGIQKRLYAMRIRRWHHRNAQRTGGYR
jgi:hypothetical protein